jgi:hypothetical protein
MIFYIGSCRYTYGGILRFTCFPARLHTTSEILYFLENLGRISEVLATTPEELHNYIFGDLFHPSVKDLTKTYLQKETEVVKQTSGLVLEICSRKVYFYGDVPVSNFYINCHGRHLIEKYNLKLVSLEDDVLSRDMEKIKRLTRTIFPTWNDTFRVHIIPHLNLKTISLQDYIPERRSLKNSLKQISSSMGYEFHDIGEFLETYHSGLGIDKDIHLEDVMSDSLHYDYTHYYQALFHYLSNKIK